MWSKNRQPSKKWKWLDRINYHVDGCKLQVWIKPPRRTCPYYLVLLLINLFLQSVILKKLSWWKGSYKYYDDTYMHKCCPCWCFPQMVIQFCLPTWRSKRDFKWLWRDALINPWKTFSIINILNVYHHISTRRRRPSIYVWAFTF